MSRATVPAQEWGTLRVARLVRGLERLIERENRAALAALRRGLGKEPGGAPEMFPIIVPLLPAARLRRRDEACAYLIASLFGMHPRSWKAEGSGRRSRNLGASLRQLRQRTESEGPQRRFVALLNSDADDLGHRLRDVIGLLRDAGLPVDWEQLTRDILAWERADREVQLRWARAFWGEEREPSEAGASVDEA